jgi:Xaa-Pro aminopeptidase
MRDSERIDRIRGALGAAALDAVVCALPSNVVLLSGYWPVVGTSIGVATRDGTVGLALPEDELDLTSSGWADLQETFAPASIESVPSLPAAITDPLSRLLRRLGVTGGRIGYERGPMLEPSSYAGTNRYGTAIPTLLSNLHPAAALVAADDVLLDLRAVLTRRELARLRLACRVAGEAFRTGAASLVPGAPEREVAAAFRAPLEAYADREGDALVRAGGFTWCMSGPDAALAYRAYARTRNRRIRFGEPVMVHCNSFVDGLWTDITRTYHPGGADERVHELFEAVLAARAAAIGAVAPGVRASTVDRAAREVLEARGLGAAFRHGTGHGVGFAAIDHHGRPRIHPASPDVLEQGMVFTVEPAVYIEGWGGLRQCEMVAVTSEGAELLTPFQSGLDVLAPRLWEPR